MPSIIKGALDRDLVAICKELKASRQMMGLSISEVQRRTEIARRSIESWEQGKAVPHVHNLKIWAKALGYGVKIDIYVRGA